MVDSSTAVEVGKLPSGCSEDSMETYYYDNDEDGYGTTSSYYQVKSCSTEGTNFNLSTNNTDVCDYNSATTTYLTGYYYDTDADGYGGSAVPNLCSTPSSSYSYVTNNSDCDDTDETVTIGASYYIDSDGDGYGDASATATTTTSCSSTVPGRMEIVRRQNAAETANAQAVSLLTVPAGASRLRTTSSRSEAACDLLPQRPSDQHAGAPYHRSTDT